VIDFSYRISCIISVPSEELLAHAFHYEIDKVSINETFNRPAASFALAEDKTMSELFEPMIQAYADEYGLRRDQIQITRYVIASGHKDITASFWNGSEEKKVETIDGAMKAIAYYDEDQNLGYGLELYEYISKLPNNTFALRVGEQVPPGDVNLAFIHTPRLDSDENISFIDTASVNENVIPMEQIESIVVPDENGVLSYADIISDYDPIVKRPPYDRFPSKNVNITRRFMRNDNTLSSALFYKFELKYHYDSDPADADKVFRYRGNQIQITDENGNALGPEYKYMIFAKATSVNPKIYWVKIYLQMNTDEERTFKVRYNHVENPASDIQLQSVTKTIELYSNKGNLNMIEGGKLRIINGIGAYEKTTLSTVRAADPSQEVYAIEEHADKDGYKITVPQKSEHDPRPKTPFNYKLTAKFRDDEGNNRQITFGYLTDWVIHKDALLAHEKLEYTDEWKSIGLKTGAGYFDARSLINMVIPLDMPSLPIDATFEISDAEGNLLYTTTSAPDKADVVTSTNESGSEPPKAKTTLATPKWTGAVGSNVRIKNNPIPHVCTIFPERQKTELEFEWEASGEGTVTSSLSYEGKWRVCQEVAIELKHTTKPIDAFNNWEFIGTDITRNKWQYDRARDVLLLTTNAVELSGFYNADHRDKQNYIFSACVQVVDENDDDVIGILFRVRDEHRFYCFLWEKQEMMRKPAPNGNGVGRILVSERGVSAALYYDPARYTKSDVDTNFDDIWDMNEYMNETGFRNKKKRIYKASPSRLPEYSDDLHPDCKYKYDKTGASFEDITDYNDTYNAKGWVVGETYKIRVVVKGGHFQVYIGNDTSDDALGTLVCEGYDDEYDDGAYGICNISQENAYWSKLTFEELDVYTACTDWEPITLTTNDWVKASPKKPEELLTPKIEQYIKDKYGELYKYTKEKPEGVGDPSNLRVDIRNDGYIWCRTSDYRAGGTVTTPWKTSENGKNIRGTGRAVLRADGVMEVTLNPSVLSRDGIPSQVNNFTWKDIWQTGGDPVRLQINGDDTVIAIVDIPPITPNGKPYTIDLDQIYKHEGIKKLKNLFGDGGIFEKLEIPSDTPMDQILLRIERGDINGNNKEHRVNYRWRYLLNGQMKFEVDQAYYGVNRMRMKNILKENKRDILDNLVVDLVAWTTFEDLEVVPILAIRLDDDRKIEVEKPKVEYGNMEIDNWYVRVKNGRVRKRLVLPYYEPAERIPMIYASYPELAAYAPRTPDDRVEVVLDYTIPEYNNQEFYNRPIMLVEREKPAILNEKMIQTRFAPIVLSSETGISYLEVEALRINESRKMRISDVDAQKGIIYLHDKIRDQDEVIVRYAYLEDWYTYRGFERRNPTTGRLEFFHLDFNPSPGHKYTLAKDGIHEWIPGDIPTREVYTEVEKPSNELLVKQIHVYLRPTSIWIQEDEGLRLIEGTTRNQAIFHTDEGHWFDPQDYYYDPTMLRLGKFAVQANSDMDKDMIILDTRTRGGGLDEQLSREVIAQVNKESLHHWDIGFFDGEAYQENGVMIIRLPRSILKTQKNPGGFHESEIQDAVAKHKAYGALPIIEYYDEDPTDVNIIGNAEFLYGKHIEEYNKDLSSGVYVIDQDNAGTGDNFILKLKDDAKYAVTIPGNKLTHRNYEIDVKARKEPGASDRSAGRIQITYQNGTVNSILLDVIDDENWMIYKATVELTGDIYRLDIIVNDQDGPAPTGTIQVDYVKMFPRFEDTENMEVVEI
jgi:hypothetical protein